MRGRGKIFLSPSLLLRRNIWQSCHVFMRSILIPFRDPESVIHLLPFYFFLCSFRSRSNQMNNRKERGERIERGREKRKKERKGKMLKQWKENASTQNSLTLSQGPEQISRRLYYFDPRTTHDLNPYFLPSFPSQFFDSLTSYFLDDEGENEGERE